MSQTLARRSLSRPWIWSFFLAAIVWLTVLALTGGRGGGSALAVAVQFASYFVLVGLGQMLVISTGPGNVDLSIPGVMTLSAFVAMAGTGGSNSGLLLGIPEGIAVGIAIGLVNSFLIRILLIPPMIATLAVGFALQSFAIAYSAAYSAKPPPALTGFVNAHIFGIPVLAAVVVIVTIVIGQVLLRTSFGRAILATGQNMRAAYLAGLKVGFTVSAVYVLSGAFASLAGILLAAFGGGASLDMASDFTLMSIAVVVLGGTAITGGQAVPVGIWGAATLLQLIATVLNVLGVGTGTRDAITGLIIIVMLAIAGGGPRQT